MNEEAVGKIVRRVVDELDRARPASLAAVPADWPPRTVALGADHGGFALKEDLRRFVKSKGYAAIDCGTSGTEPCDYPDFAARVAELVREAKCEAGIVVDTAGIGSSIAANKIAGVRCALCHDVASVLNAREHNDANVLALGAKVVPAALARRMVALFLSTSHLADRHLRRVKKIAELEA